MDTIGPCRVTGAMSLQSELCKKLIPSGRVACPPEFLLGAFWARDLLQIATRLLGTGAVQLFQLDVLFDASPVRLHAKVVELAHF